MGNLRNEFEDREEQNQISHESRDLKKFQLIEKFDEIIRFDEFFMSIGTQEIYSSTSQTKRYYGIKAGGEKRVFEISVCDHNHYYETGDTIFHQDKLIRQDFNEYILYFPSHTHNRENSRIITYFSDPRESAIYLAGIIGDGKNWSDVCLTFLQLSELKKYKSSHPESVPIFRFIDGFFHNAGVWIGVIYAIIMAAALIYKFM